MFIVAVGVSHKTTPIEIREKLAFDNAQIASAFQRLKSSGAIAGCVILSTCNRTEIYATSKDIDSALAEIWSLLSDKSGIGVNQLQDYIYNITCQKAITQLFRVACGLDSMILGEMEILGQIARAYQIACENSASNTVLNVLFQKAIKVGKQIRTETRIGNGASSVGSAAVELARKMFDDIENRSILLIGAGEMGKLVARNLTNNGVSDVTVCNRSHGKAKKLAIQYDGYTISFDDLEEYLPKADLVLACTSAPIYVITMKQLEKAMEMRNYKPMLLIDLAIPRDIDPESAEIHNISLFNIDDLKNMVDQSLHKRKLEAQKAEIIVENAIEHFLRWLNNIHAIPVIKALHQKGGMIRDAELEKAMNKLGPLTEREEKILRSMAHSITSKLINTPIVQLKECNNTEQSYIYAQVTMDLFQLSSHVDEALMEDQIEEQSDLEDILYSVAMDR